VENSFDISGEAKFGSLNHLSWYLSLRQIFIIRKAEHRPFQGIGREAASDRTSGVLNSGVAKEAKVESIPGAGNVGAMAALDDPFSSILHPTTYLGLWLCSCFHIDLKNVLAAGDDKR
jgi:hypothetical protein